MVSQFRTHLTTSLIAQGASHAQARRLAAGIAQLSGPHGAAGTIPQFVQLDFAHATSSVLMAMSWVMVAAAVVALRGLPRQARRAAADRPIRRSQQPVLSSAA